MRTITYGGAVSLNGFLAGLDGSIDWLHFSKDVQQVMTDYWKNVDTILMGRKTYAFAVLLGAGIPTFRDPGHRVKLTLTECRSLEGGCILAQYEVSTKSITAPSKVPIRQSGKVPHSTDPL